MTKEQYIEQYLDKYEQAHPDKKIDYQALREQADMEWYDNEVDHGNATEYDLTPEQEKVAKEATKGMARAVNAYGKEIKRVRKENPDKREIISTIAKNLARVCDPDEQGDANAENIVISNVERQIDFLFKNVQYSITLTAHRKPKTK